MPLRTADFESAASTVSPLRRWEEESYGERRGVSPAGEDPGGEGGGDQAGVGVLVVGEEGQRAGVGSAPVDADHGALGDGPGQRGGGDEVTDAAGLDGEGAAG